VDTGWLVAMLEVKLIDRARKGWDWEVGDQTGAVMARGRQKTRLAAKYQAERMLFQLLVAVCWTRPRNTDLDTRRA
jgi:hypothetical protein